MHYVVVILDGSGLNKNNKPFVTVITTVAILNTFSYYIVSVFLMNMDF